MKAMDENGLEFEVFAKNNDRIVVDDGGDSFVYIGLADDEGTIEQYRDVADGEVIEVERCECQAPDDDLAWGAFANGDDSSAAVLTINRCDTCARYASDQDAAQAFVRALNERAGGVAFAAEGWEVRPIGPMKDRARKAWTFALARSGIDLDAERRGVRLANLEDLEDEYPVEESGEGDLALERFALIQTREDGGLTDRYRRTTHPSIEAAGDFAASDARTWVPTVLIDLDTGDRFEPRVTMAVRFDRARAPKSPDHETRSRIGGAGEEN